jgi:RNA polymerase sigma-70 factor, ECF subfamily
VFTTRRAIITRMPGADDCNAVVIRDLIQRQRVDDNFQKLFRAFYLPVFNFFSRSGFTNEECQDLTQEVFLAVYNGVQNLRHEGAFVAWLFSIARHIGMRHVDRKRRAPRAERSEETDRIVEMVPARDSNALERMLDQEKAAVVRKAIDSLPVREQDCLRARFFDDLRNGDIAQKLGISENTVAVHVHRGLKNIRASLQRVLEAPSTGEI